MNKNTAISLLIILLAWSVLSLFRISGRDLWSSGETRDAEIAQEMLQTGDFIIPRFNGEFLAWKPPLFHWFECLASIVTGGRVTSLSSRMPSSFFFLAGALGLYFLLAGLAGERGRLFSALVFLSAYKFTWMSRVAQIDAMFAVLVGLACLSFFRAYSKRVSPSQEGKKASFMPFYVLSALSVLAKGPAGVVLIAGGILLFLAFERNLPFILEILEWKGLLAFFLIGGSWYAAVLILKGNDFFQEFFINQNIHRFFQAFDHRKPFLYYISQFVGGFMPWTLFFAAAVVFLVLRPGQGKRRPLPLFLFSCAVFIFLFFSFSQSKRGVYILPMYFPAAALTGFFLGDFSERESPFYLVRIPGILNALILFVLGAVVSAVLDAGILDLLRRSIEPYLSGFDKIMFPHIAPMIAHNRGIFLSVAGFLFLACALLFWAASRRSTALIVSIHVAVAAVLVSAAVGIVMPVFNANRSLKPFAEKFCLAVGPKDVIYSYKIGIEDLAYYSGRKMITIRKMTPRVKSELVGSKKGYFMFVGKKYLPELDELGLSYRVLFPTGILQLDGLLLKVGP
jgi:4-amino-4-deoxy-L-arabinose transferase-like glycosyltransferase